MRLATDRGYKFKMAFPAGLCIQSRDSVKFNDNF